MAEKDNFVVRAFKWVGGSISDNVSAWIAVIVGGLAMSVLTALTEVMTQYAPLSWGVAGLLGFLVIAIVLALYGVYRRYMTDTNFEEKRASTLSVNPADKNFERRRIQLHDFFHPFLIPTTGARFNECELFGPAILLLEGGSLEHNEFHACDFVVMRNDQRVPILTATIFKETVFRQCAFYRVLFLVTQPQFEKLKAQAPPGPNLITRENPK